MPNKRDNTNPLSRLMKKFMSTESGVTLLETLVALAILGFVAVAFLSGLTTAARATFIADEQATAESLARSEIEYVKSQEYEPAGQYQYRVQREEFETAGYTTDTTVDSIDPDTGETLQPGQDEGIQKITVTVERNGNPIITVESYKAQRI